MRWKDSRTQNPDSKSSKIYPVLFINKGFHTTAQYGYATWMPKDNYTNGEWIDITYQNRNSTSDTEVLYWIDLPSYPADIEI